MSQKQKEYITTPAFPEPNYTQTPNNFFEMLPDMEHSEVNVTLVMIRQTFGFHRNGFKMGINKLAEAAGLSRNAAKDGAEAAEKRGTFRRVNPTEQTEAEWELVVGQSVTTLQPVTRDGQSVEGTPPTSDSQVRVKENKKKIKKEKSEATPKASDFPELVLHRAVINHWCKPFQRQTIIDAIQKINDRLGRNATQDDLQPYFTEWGKVSGNQFSLVWLVDWAVNGKLPNGNKQTANKQPQPPQDNFMAELAAKKQRLQQEVTA